MTYPKHLCYPSRGQRADRLIASLPPGAKSSKLGWGSYNVFIGDDDRVTAILSTAGLYGKWNLAELHCSDMSEEDAADFARSILAWAERCRAKSEKSTP